MSSPSPLDLWRQRVTRDLAPRPLAQLDTPLLDGRTIAPLYAERPLNTAPLGTSSPHLASADTLPASPPGCPLAALTSASTSTSQCLDLRPLELAGAHATDELAALALALVHRCASPTPCANLHIITSLSSDFVNQIAKLRAINLLTHRILELESPTPLPSITLHAVTSTRAFTQHDPWTNLLRTTASVFAAALGGADLITPLPFDLLAPTPSRDAQRLADHTVRLALDEAHLARVHDPLAGSFAVESLTDALAASAWTRFQALHALGGLDALPARADLLTSIADTRARRQARVQTLRDPLIGTSLYPDLDEPLPPPPPPAPGDLRLAAPFERLRAQARALPTPPRALIATLGPPSEHLPRTSWTQGFLEAGGIHTTIAPADPPATRAPHLLATHAPAFVVISASDAHLATATLAATAAFSTAGAHVLIAGRPGPHEPALRAAGTQGFLHLGLDLIATLTPLLALAGAPR